MKLDTLLNKFEKMTKGYEKLSGEKIPAGYYSSCTTAIQEAYEQGLLTKLKAILKRNKDPTFGTYDYDGIAVEVIKLVTK